MTYSILPRSFYLQDTRKVAQQLLGKLLVRSVCGRRLAGIIVETEAYRGFDDTASHAHKGPTKRCKVMFGEAGYAYVYLTYGVHNMLNFVTEERAFPAAVLIRAIQPISGTKQMCINRKNSNWENLTSGPGKLTQAFNIDRSLNGSDLTLGVKIWVERLNANMAQWFHSYKVEESTRVGIDYADRRARERRWRFLVQGNRFVSRFK